VAWSAEPFANRLILISAGLAEHVAIRLRSNRPVRISRDLAGPASRLMSCPRRGAHLPCRVGLCFFERDAHFWSIRGYRDMLTARSTLLAVSCVLALAEGSAQAANLQPNALPLSYASASLLTKVEGLPEPMGSGPAPIGPGPDRTHSGYGQTAGGSLRNAVCPPGRPYYKPSSYSRYMRHRFRPLRDYYPFDPPFRCASWPWSTEVCVGQYVAAHPVPVGIDCVR
jgi:hypothetical protein